MMNITSEVLNNLEKESGLTDLSTNPNFLDILKLDRAIIYILVNWSAPERLSRYNIYKAFTELNINKMPLYKVDCSEQTENPVIDWLNLQREYKKDFNYAGCGETLLIDKGNIIDCIKNPGQLGQEQTKAKLLEWCQA